MPQLLAQ